MALVEIECGAGVAVVTLNRPESMNALSRALQNELADAFTDVAADPSVRAIVLTGAGDRAFCAGLDLKELGAHGLRLTADGGEVKNPAAAIAECAKPIIAAVNGVAVTGGFELALSCDIMIASTNARFADTHARIGVTPGWGLSQRLSRAIGISRAKELSLTGNFLDAQTALAWGLVNRVVAPGELLPAARALAADIASCDPDMIKRYKALIDDGFGLTFSDAMALERSRNRTENANLAAEALETRRGEVMARGHAQKSKG